MKNNFNGQSVLVTGGSSGIGRAIAIRFAREGADLAINYHEDSDPAEETIRLSREAANGRDVKAITVKADISQEKEVVSMFETVTSELGEIDVLINNAGLQIEEASDQMSVDDFDMVIGVNLKGAFLCAREMIRHSLARNKKSNIINVSSVHQIIPRPRFVGYAASKSGLGGITTTLALEYAERGIRVNAIAPGATATKMNKDWKKDKEKREKLAANIPLRRAAEPEEMAGIATFLASDDASYITGQTIYADGGLTLYPKFEEPWT